jgi:C4-dicarboxylate-specific signal transduction histidine kinase
VSAETARFDRHLRVALCPDGPEVVLVVQGDGCGFKPAHTQAPS